MNIFMFMLLLIFLLTIFYYYQIMMSFKMNIISKLEIECGMFNIINKNYSSMNYSLFLILFLIFDLEIILFFLLMEKIMNLNFLLMMMLILLSLILEIFECSLKWND